MSEPESITISEYIARPAADVYAALIQPGELEQYFLSSASASPLDAREITWWIDDQTSFRFQVAGLRSEQLIELRWQPPELPDGLLLSLTLIEEGSGTQLLISETGWPADDRLLDQKQEHQALWQRLASNLKAWLEQ